MAVNVLHFSVFGWWKWCVHVCMWDGDLTGISELIGSLSLNVWRRRYHWFLLIAKEGGQPTDSTQRWVDKSAAWWDFFFPLSFLPPHYFWPLNPKWILIQAWRVDTELLTLIILLVPWYQGLSVQCSTCRQTDLDKCCRQSRNCAFRLKQW